MEFLKSTELQTQDVETFTKFVGHVQSCDSAAIKFYEHDIVEAILLRPHSSLFIIALMEG